MNRVFEQNSPAQSLSGDMAPIPSTAFEQHVLPNPVGLNHISFIDDGFGG